MGNLETLEGIGEVRILYPHHVAHQMLHLKLMLMPQPGITHITQAIMDITDTASAILDIMGTDIPIMDITGDEDKNFDFFFYFQTQQIQAQYGPHGISTKKFKNCIRCHWQ